MHNLEPPPVPLRRGSLERRHHGLRHVRISDDLIARKLMAGLAQSAILDPVGSKDNPYKQPDFLARIHAHQEASRASGIFVLKYLLVPVVVVFLLTSQCNQHDLERKNE